MSRSQTIQTSTPPVCLELVAGIAGGALAVGGLLVGAAAAILAGIGREAAAGLREVLQECREGRHPAGELLVSFTPLTNLAGYQKMLQDDGFALSERGGLVEAVGPAGQTLLLLGGDGGIGAVSADADLVQACQQRFVVEEFGRVLEEAGYAVEVRQEAGCATVTGSEPAAGRARPEGRVQEAVTVAVSGSAGGTAATVDTRRVKRPRCELVHQLVRQKLGQPAARAPGVRKSRARPELHVRR